MGAPCHYRGGGIVVAKKERKTMKQITINMDLGRIWASAVWDEGEAVVSLGSLQIDPQFHDNLMRAEQISGFLDSVVWPALQGFAREIETEQNEKDMKTEGTSGEEV
jgi:hypothetical protein